jgi:hypothetical protein
MQTAILKRADLPGLDPDQLITNNVLAYAEKTLGYKHPQRDRDLAKGELSNALRIMDFKPLTQESVERYKSHKLRKHQTSVIWYRFIINTSDVGKWQTCFILVMWLLVAPLSALIFAAVACVLGLPSDLAPVAGLLSLLFTGSIPFILSWYARKRKWKSRTAFWRSIPMKGYSAPIPEIALATAMEVHQRVPKVTFAIEELVVERQKSSPIIDDPFLVAILGNERYYLEVWEEPGYKQERMA